MATPYSTPYKTPYIGTAGWSIPKAHGDRFPKNGTHLERYAHCLSAVEVNSSFYRDHQEATYYRWNYSTPPEFRFSVKFPRRYSHDANFALTKEEAKATLEPIHGLKEKLGVLLVQLPPKMAFDPDKADSFFGAIRAHYEGPLACEPRHRSWGEQMDFFQRFHVSKVKADPEPCPSANDEIHRAGGFTYRRLHGSPEIYRSSYDDDFLRQLASELTEPNSWCIFDNTTFGHATKNALDLQYGVLAQDHKVA